jgi:hypothetical protein
MKSKALSLIVMALLGPELGARAQEAPIPHGCSVTPAELRLHGIRRETGRFPLPGALVFGRLIRAVH